ncbi:MAG TPA: hypothetical protein VNZ52_08120 [Candidatus Thermoplasmatota archaeon]|nr:hypothetical protein [Candidatus Thermoplasmatota archaeon]
MDPFAPLDPYTSPAMEATLAGDLNAEFSKDPPPTTQSCAETGCGGPVLDWA